jgi:CheY-like chemotaxis protein
MRASAGSFSIGRPTHESFYASKQKYRVLILADIGSLPSIRQVKRENEMRRILIVEDDAEDYRFAEKCARRVGITEIQASPSAAATIAILEKAHIDKSALPDVILIDLDLGPESGFDFLRYRYRHPKFSTIPVVVWTKLGDQNRAFCEIFKVQGYVSKSNGEFDLVEAFKKVRS